MSANTRQHARPGFTLTEMLVAVTLLLVIMTIFAQIFQIAVTSMTRQKGMANNDQRSRTALSIIDADLKRMSYRPIEGHQGIVPLVPGIRYDELYAASDQRGYFYYSENNPDDDTDDVLQFTIDTTLLGETKSSKRYAGQSQLPLFGKAVTILDANGNARRDQPDWDDGIRDGISQSRWAEVSYFLRHGTLYRRVMLLRDTDDGVPFSMENIDRGNKRRLAQPGYRIDADTAYDMMWDYTGNFYSDFDFSAHHDNSPYDPSAPEVAVFHSTLSNEPQNNWPLGVPHYRFGFYHANGLPREYITDGTNNYFMGRFTHEETSHPNFGYPQFYLGPGNPHPFNLSFNVARFIATGRLERADGEPGFLNNLPDSRRGTDVVMSNVVGFDVKIWDESANNFAGAFVDIDHRRMRDFGARNNLGQRHFHENPNFGPTNETGAPVHRNVLDSWHSSFSDAGVPGFTESNNPHPPKTPIIYHPFWMDPSTPPGDPTEPPPPYAPANRLVPRWQSGVVPLIDGMLVFPSRNDLPYSHYIKWRAEFQKPLPNGLFLGDEPPQWDPGEPDFFMHSIDLIDISLGARIPDPNDYNDDGSMTPDVIWVAEDNRKPIRAIQITIRYLDPMSDLLRQQTMIHSFNEQGLEQALK